MLVIQYFDLSSVTKLAVSDQKLLSWRLGSRELFNFLSFALVLYMHVYSCGVVHTENFHRSTSKKIIERQVVQQNLQIISYGFKYWQVLKPLLSYLPTEISVSDIQRSCRTFTKISQKSKNLSLFFVCVELMVNQKILILLTIILFPY